VVKALCYKLGSGSRPDKVNFFNLPNPSGQTRPWGSLNKVQYYDSSGMNLRETFR
jgi:hypothetical protein